MAEINIRQLLDENGEVYYPQTHILGVDGMPENLEEFDASTVAEELSDMNAEIDGAQYDISTLQTQVAALQSAISSMPTVVDTGWVNITLSSPAIAYSTAETPQIRMVTVNNTSFVSMRGSVKGITTFPVTIGNAPAGVISKLSYTTPYVQNSSTIGGKPTYTRTRINANGNIIIENASQDTVTTSHWFPINFTFIA